LCVVAAASAQLNFGGSDSKFAKSEKKKVIFFEEDHYINKASEPGFCEDFCGSERRELVRKPGRCPAIPLIPVKGNCKNECKYDSECAGILRCCNNGCANVCMKPDFKLTCEDIAETCLATEECIDYAERDAECVETTPKPGRCLAIPAGPLSCSGDKADQCKFDSQCPGNQRCCSDGCNNVCVVPDLRLLCADIASSCPADTECVEYADRDAACVNTTPKDGLCPRYKNDSRPLGGCENTCRFDAECDGDAKCCWNGCASKCLKPRKPGCTEIKCDLGFKCVEEEAGPKCKEIPCYQDGQVVNIECVSCMCIDFTDGVGRLLCPKKECPPTKPGFCPRLVKGYKGRCVEDCSSDYDCEDESKCCDSGCGHVCKKPAKAIVHPCKTVRFRCGDDTRCAATRGICRPGRPCPLVPLCVSNRVPYCESCPEGTACVLQKRACFGQGRCQRQPVCIQLYLNNALFEENEDLEVAVVAKQQAARFDAELF